MSELPDFKRIKSRNGKDLNLFVGLYYSISVKSIPNCLVTYEKEPREDTNLMQIALDTEDYEPEGVLRKNALWTILPTGEGENNYFLKVLSRPEGILTYSHSLSWGGRYLELDLRTENYKPGATMHSSSLWHFEPTELPEYFTIHNSDDRRNVNFVTFSNEPSENGQLMQIGTKDLQYYHPKGKFRNDALWNFRPANFVLSANICNFDYELPDMEEMKSASVPIRITDEIIVMNDTTNSYIELDEGIPLNEVFALHFLQSFKAFQEENITIDCDLLKKICGSNDKLNFGKISNTHWFASQDRNFPIKEKLLVDPGASASVTGFCNWLYKAEIMFNAEVEIRATCDVAYCPTPVQLHCVNTEIQDPDIIEYLLRYEKFTGKIVPRNKNSPPGKVVCKIGGKLKCSFGLDTKLQVKYL